MRPFTTSADDDVPIKVKYKAERSPVGTLIEERKYGSYGVHMNQTNCIL